MMSSPDSVAEAEAVAVRAWTPRQEAGALESAVQLWGLLALLSLLAVAWALEHWRCR